MFDGRPVRFCKGRGNLSMRTSGDLKSPWLYCRQNFGRGMDFEGESASAGWPGRKPISRMISRAGYC